MLRRTFLALGLVPVLCVLLFTPSAPAPPPQFYASWSGYDVWGNLNVTWTWTGYTPDSIDGQDMGPPAQAPFGPFPIRPGQTSATLVYWGSKSGDMVVADIYQNNVWLAEAYMQAP